MALIAGDNSVYQVKVLKRSDGTAKDLTGATVKLRYSIDGAQSVEKTMSVTDATGGEAQYRFETSDLSAGSARFEVVVTDTGGNVETTDPPRHEDVRSPI